MKRLLAGLLLAALVASPVAAAKPSDFALTATTHVTGVAVKQQSDDPACYDDDSCVVNSTDCIWDIDDRVVWQGGGFIASGQREVVTECLFADWAIHLFGVEVYATSPDLLINVAFAPQGTGWSFTHEYVPDRNQWLYRGCVQGPRYTNVAPELEPIADSNGGVAVPTTFAVSVEHPPYKGKAVGISATITYRLSEPASERRYCKGDLSPTFSLGGALWRVAY